jgi:hypothetical protein
MTGLPYDARRYMSGGRRTERRIAFDATAETNLSQPGPPTSVQVGSSGARRRSDLPVPRSVPPSLIPHVGATPDPRANRDGEGTHDDNRQNDGQHRQGP